MTLGNLRKAAILQQDRPQMLETSREVEALKTRLTLPNGKYKSFYYGWNRPIKLQGQHEARLSKSNNPKTKDNCCFYHIIGAAQKDGHDMPLLSYQKLLYRMLQERKQIWIKKSRGLGVTTFFLYWIAYCYLTKWKAGDRVCVVVGPRIDLAEDFIARFKRLFARNFPGIYAELSKQGSTYAILNLVKVEAFPSHHVDAMRGLDKVKFILADEADYFPPFQQKEVRSVIEGYIGKPNSDPTVVLVSTPNAPNGLFQQIELEPNSLYYKFFLDYHYGLEGPHPIYSEEQIEKAKLSPDFPREFEGQYLGLIGNVISPTAIDCCLELGEEMDKTTPIDDWSIQTQYVMGIDAGYGSSNTAIMVSRFVNGKVQLIYAKEFTRPNFSDIIDTVWDLKDRCPDGGLQNIIIDASNSELYTALCTEFKQNPSPKYLADKQAWCKKVNTPLESHLFVIPVPFSIRGREMLSHLKWIVEEQDEDNKAMFALDNRFNQVVTALRTAQATEGLLSKEDTAFDDTLDSLRLNLSFYRRSV